MSQDPTYIGRYKVLGELGQGAMGVVYLAEDPLLKRGVAIKAVHGGTAAQAEALRRFQQEAEISARLCHPNVITIFDVGDEPGLGPFMAMEYVDGESLADRLAKGPMETEQSALLLIQGLHALEAAHARGIVHRDFKPENLMISSDGRLKLMDFGIARTEAGLVTTEVLCTPMYAAPELLDRQPPSPATDRWAYCVTAFWMTLGSLPYQAPSMSALLYSITHEPPVFPEGTSADLQAVFEHALAKEPASRPSDLRIFLNDLLEALPLSKDARIRCHTLLEAGTTSMLSGPYRAYREKAGGWRPWFHFPRLAWLLAALVLLLMLGLFEAWNLEVLLPRRVSVRSTPPGATVFLDDASLGVTPLLDVKVPRGTHLLRLEKKDFLTREQSIKKGDRDLALDLVPKPVLLELKSEPAGAEVFLDGVLAGTTPVDRLEIAGVEEHRLMIRKTGFEPWLMPVSRENPPPPLVKLKKVEVHRKPKPKPFWKRLFP